MRNPLRLLCGRMNPDYANSSSGSGFRVKPLGHQTLYHAHSDAWVGVRFGSCDFSRVTGRTLPGCLGDLYSASRHSASPSFGLQLAYRRECGMCSR
jgi:hypothetical protein